MSKMKSIREIEMERAAQPNFGKGITVASGFDLGAKAPLDSRATVKTLAERDAHLTGNRAYEGMLVYVEADKKTYQLVDGQWKVFGFDNDQFEANVEDTLESDSQTTALSAKQGKVLKGMIDAQSSQLSTIEGKVDKAIEDIAGLGTDLEGRLDTAEAAIAKNTAAITKEVQDRTQAVNAVDSKLTAEVSRATAAEGALGSRIDGVETSVEEVRSSVDTKTAQTLKDAKAYTDEKVVEINAANEALKTKVEANEAALGLVDGKIAAAKSEAINTSNAHTTSEIAKIDAAYKAADVQTLESAKSYADTKIGEAKTALEGSIATVDGKVSANESAISDLRDAISNKNSNTIVVETEAEIATANSNPKVGDLAFVITSKRAYIYKGVEALTAKNAPEGWVVFDEITNELDLVNYLKKSEAESTYRKLVDKIAESDLATDLSSKINGKADTSYVNSELAKKATPAQITAAVTPVSQKANANESAIAQEVTDRQGEITRVEGLVTSVDGKVNGLSTSLTEKETALKAEDTKLNNRISKFAPVVAEEEPTETEAGHVWLQLV